MENCVPASREHRIWIPESEGADPVKLILDFRAFRLVDRGYTLRALAGLQEPVLEKFEIWVRDEKEKRAMGTMLSGRGWNMRGGELVKVVARD